MLTYSLDSAGERTRLEADFPQFSYRIKSLEDRMIAFFLRGDPDCLICCGFQLSSEPHFVSVTFDEAKAAQYEEFMQKFFRRYRNKENSTLPRPDFPVELSVSFGHVCEPFEFHFENYNEDVLLHFCKLIKNRAYYLFRQRYAR